MLHLEPDECRVLGVLVEKAQTTPGQYPLTLNALTAGCNQKNNRDPVVTWDEDRVLDAIDSLRTKGVVREVLLTGSRVTKYRHIAREVWEIDTPQLVVLAELLLRGPQSAGELRGNATRMHPLESLEVTLSVLESLRTRGEPMVAELPPPPGSRAKLYTQLLCPNLHPLPTAAGSSADSGTHSPSHSHAHAHAHAPTNDSPLKARVDDLERQVLELRAQVERLARALGPTPPDSAR